MPPNTTHHSTTIEQETGKTVERTNTHEEHVEQPPATKVSTDKEEVRETPAPDKQ